MEIRGLNFLHIFLLVIDFPCWWGEEVGVSPAGPLSSLPSDNSWRLKTVSTIARNIWRRSMHVDSTTLLVCEIRELISISEVSLWRRASTIMKFFLFSRSFNFNVVARHSSAATSTPPHFSFCHCWLRNIIFTSLVQRNVTTTAAAVNSKLCIKRILLFAFIPFHDTSKYLDSSKHTAEKKARNYSINKDVRHLSSNLSHQRNGKKKGDVR